MLWQQRGRRGPRAAAERHALWGLLFVAGWPWPGEATTPGLTLQQATAQALSQPAVTRWLSAQPKGAAAAATLATAWRPPTLDLGHEQLATGGGSEQTLVLSQGMDLSGRRGLLRQAGEAQTRAAKARAQAWRIRLLADVQGHFYAALHLQLRAAHLSAWRLRLDDAMGLMKQRTRGGESSRYDLQRLAQERRMAQAAWRSNEAQRLAARARLFGAMGRADQQGVSLSGELLPSVPSAPKDAQGVAEQQPALKALAQDIAAAALQRRSARKSWLGSLRLRGGYLTADGGQERNHGFVLGISAALPFTGRAGLQQQVISARSEALTAERALALQQLSGRITALAARAGELHGAATELRGTGQPDRQVMLNMAQAAWQGGELGLLGLLDAHRRATEEALQVLKLEYQARQAAIELQAASQGSLP